MVFSAYLGTGDINVELKMKSPRTHIKVGLFHYFNSSVYKIAMLLLINIEDKHTVSVVHVAAVTCHLYGGKNFIYTETMYLAKVLHD
jgi:hypothetical protein